MAVNIGTDRSGQWLQSSILHLVDEAVSGRVGSEAMLAKLSEALFVDTLRRYVAGLPERNRGWLTGARDPIVGKSLGLMHRAGGMDEVYRARDTRLGRVVAIKVLASHLFSSAELKHCMGPLSWADSTLRTETSSEFRQVPDQNQ